jgi:hypothetical protein
MECADMRKNVQNLLSPVSIIIKKYNAAGADHSHSEIAYGKMDS